MNRSGFSLIQVLVASVILGVLALVIASGMSSMSKQERRLRLARESRELGTELRAATKLPQCGLADLAAPITVTDSGWSGTTVYELPGGLDSRLLRLKSGDKYGPFTVERVRFESWIDPTGPGRDYISIDGASPTDFSGGSIVRAALAVHVKANGWNGRAIQSPVFLRLNLSRTEIQSCTAELSGEGLSLAAVCANFGGHWFADTGRCRLPSAGDPAPAPPPPVEAPVPSAQASSAVAPDLPPNEFCNTVEECSVLMQQMRDVIDQSGLLENEK